MLIETRVDVNVKCQLLSSFNQNWNGLKVHLMKTHSIVLKLLVVSRHEETDGFVLQSFTVIVLKTTMRLDSVLYYYTTEPIY